LLLVQPGLHADALYPPEIFQDREVGAPDRVVGELDELRTGEIVAPGAGLQALFDDATVVNGTNVVVRSGCALATFAAATVTGIVQQQLSATATIQAARGGQHLSLV
jgi:hypothetical protein